MTGDFALAAHALVFLSRRQCCTSSACLAKNICTNAARVRKVMAKLVRAGLASARQGADGGFLAAKPPREITLADLLLALDENCVERLWRSGDPNMDCIIASGMADVMEEVYGEINLVCAQLLSQITLEQLYVRLQKAKAKQCP
jgi:DNA-binding IscR family transcriptional regulator